MKWRTGETVALSVNSFWGSKKGDMGSKSMSGGKKGSRDKGGQPGGP